MKKLFLIPFFILFFILTNKSYSKNMKKDTKTGLELTLNKLEVSSFEVVVDGKPLPSNEVEFGAAIFLNLKSVAGFTRKGNLFFPGCEIKLLDSNGKEILFIKDAYEKNYSQGATGSDLYTDLTTGDPMKIGETYTWKVRFWDKNGKGEINSEMKLKVKANQCKIDHKIEEGFSFLNLYLVSEKKVVMKNEFKSGETIYLYVTNLKGFNLKNNKVYPGWSITFTDSKGNVVIKNDDVFANQSEGFDLKNGDTFHMNVNTGNPIKSGETYTWKSILWDKNGKAKLTTETILKAK